MVEQFRRRVRSWLAQRSGDAHGGGTVGIAAARSFQEKLHAAGFAGICWPVEFGGQGLDEEYQRAFDEEAAAFDLPVEPFAIGLTMVGPTLLALGTHEQRSRYLAPMLRGEEIWCQLLSEPGAGSDLAAVSCRARADGDGFVLTGQKVWISRARWADLGVLLACTDPGQPKHRNLTLLVVDMHAPGVTVRPLRDMAGREVFNDVFLDGVRVPSGRVIGGLHGGWAATMTMLQHERRGTSVRLRAGQGTVSFEWLLAAIGERGIGDQPVVRQRMAELYVRQRSLELFRARLDQQLRAGAGPGARGSVGKLAWAELDRFAVDVAAELIGTDGVAWDEDSPDGHRWAEALCVALSTAIAGGTNEIQRTVIGERVLGLPREPAC